MKKIANIIALTLLCACGRGFTGLGSVDLQITSITFRDSDPATITGNLASGKPADFILAANSPLLQELRVTCHSPEDTQGMAEVNDLIGFPLFCTVDPMAPPQGSATLQMLLGGMSWAPDYSIAQENGSHRIYASVRVENMTVQTWQADTVRFMDPQNRTVTTATGRITVRQGSSLIPWWNAPAGNPAPVIRYGWPVPGRWNPLLAVFCPAGGRIESWTGQVFSSNDTLYFPADSAIEIDLAFQQLEREYQCFLTLRSKAEEPVEWTIQWPDRLPRGSAIIPGSNSILLLPGETTTILYKEVY